MRFCFPRERWGEGPWRDEPDELGPWYAHGLRCWLIRGPAGAWCGYVEPPVIGVDTSDLEVHWGVTFEGEHSLIEGHPFVVGFDCGHAFDVAPALDAQLDALERTEAEQAQRDALQAILDQAPEPFRDTYRTMDFAKEQTEHLAYQLSKVKA